MIEDFDINGRWKYSEDFGFGTDLGFAEFKYTNEKIHGYLEYTETINGEEPFTIRQHVQGEIIEDKAYFNGISYELLDGDEDIVYNLDTWEGLITDEGKIVGSTFDNEDVFGVFVLER
ncbi:hypothetical protein EMN47_19260 [Prolixibacteraceae bacterium JC049]|nr:hypothetical protein [Prolixibacteraceae bacterium JC049]